MKITEFLKKHSLINSKFIDDFYSFYDEGQNEYDYTIDLEKLAYWLQLRKDNLKVLLDSNFDENEDYVILDKPSNGKGMGYGKNNRKPIMLRYTCAKELCMISRSPKSSVIRKFYIDLEKLLITYKDSIVNDLNEQLGIKDTNMKIIEQNKNKGMIYILKLEKGDFKDNEPIDIKIGSTNDMAKRLKQYNVGRIEELPIIFAYLTDDINNMERCIRQNLKNYQLKYKTEIFKIDLDFVKETVKYCSLKNSVLIKNNKKLLNNRKKDVEYVIMIDRENLDKVDNLLLSVKKDKQKKLSKKSSRNQSKQSKKPLKNLSKKQSKKSSKQTSKSKSTITKQKIKLGRPKKIKY
jgi:phage anti-repressor protein